MDFVEVDAIADDRGLIVEVYARQGKLKDAQIRKIGQDILKLALLRRHPGYRTATMIIAFAGEPAYDSITGASRSSHVVQHRSCASRNS